MKRIDDKLEKGSQVFWAEDTYVLSGKFELESDDGYLVEFKDGFRLTEYRHLDKSVQLFTRIEHAYRNLIDKLTNELNKKPDESIETLRKEMGELRERCDKAEKRAEDAKITANEAFSYADRMKQIIRHAFINELKSVSDDLI